MRVFCDKCRRYVRSRRSDGRLVYHRDALRQRQWCERSPGYQPRSTTKRNAYAERAAAALREQAKTQETE